MSRLESVREAQRLRADGMSVREVAKSMGVARGTVYGYLEDPDGSKMAARKRKYRGVCQSCDGPTQGSRPSDIPKECAQCIRWTEGEAVDAIRDWVAEYGKPPRGWEWRAANRHPSAATICAKLGWNEALLRAGCKLNLDKRPETQREIERMVREGMHPTVVAAVYGVTAQAIHNRLRYHGTSVRELQAGTPIGMMR